MKKIVLLLALAGVVTTTNVFAGQDGAGSEEMTEEQEGSTQNNVSDEVAEAAESEGDVVGEELE